MSLPSEYEKIPLGENCIVETNWSEASTPCKLFRLKMGDEECVIPRDQLFSILFLFANEKQQEDLIPVIETKVKSISRLLTFKLKKDMQKGSLVKARYDYWVPETVYEKLLLSDPNVYQPGKGVQSELEKHVNLIT